MSGPCADGGWLPDGVHRQVASVGERTRAPLPGEEWLYAAGRYRLGFDEYWAAYNFNQLYEHAPYFLNDAGPHLRQQFEPDGQTDMAIDFVKRVDGEAAPFALFLSWGPPHDPWGTNNVLAEDLAMFRDVDLPLAPNYSKISDPYADDWQKLPKDYDATIRQWMKVYYAQVANLDRNLGRLMKAVDEAGLADNTIFVFTTDHGEMFGAHGRRAKLIFYEEAARVPMLMRWPGKDWARQQDGRAAGHAGYYADAADDAGFAGAAGS